MLKYSTYRSIYDEGRVVNSSDNRLGSGTIDRIQELLGRLAEVSTGMFRQANFIKFVLVILLVVSGFTVMGNVFAGPLNLAKQEKRVVVERGDTLWSIALKHKPANMKTAVYIEGIKRSSQLTNSNIQAGDIITVPLY
jgi:hypothetical protein